MSPVYIDDLRALRQFCQTLEGETILGLDTEFIPELTYSPRLELVQIATRDGSTTIVDYGVIGRVDHDPLAPILTDPNVLKVFHSAYGDLLVLQPLADKPLGPIWDTQLVTKLFDYRGGTRYGAVVESLLGERVASGQSLTDWSKRPLSAQQLEYAAEDVRYLIALYQVQRGKLEALGRVRWAEEECQQVVADVMEALAARADESTLYRGVRGSQSLDRRSLAILRELAIWRDREARRRDRPPRSIFKDDMLVQVARRAPQHVRQLGEFRAITPRDQDKFGSDILQAVDRGKRVPEDKCPPLLASEPTLSDQEAALASLLSAALQQLAHKHRVSSTLIATMSDLHRMVDAHLHSGSAASPVLTGWRGELVGKELLAIMNGEAGVRWDPRTRSIRMEAE
ncbi:MAG TPA: HRDC domain-containing protein [Bryobacteraceae bacterium]|nr:HRDC domain-containing protein [Bryobacteraceae bacterium]